MALACLAGVGGTVTAATLGVIPLWLGGALDVLFLYYAFVPLHEAAHGNISGKSPTMKPLEAGIGIVAGSMMLIPYHGFRTIHRAHHSHTNEPDNDPDYWVAGRGGLAIALRCATILLYYFWFFARKLLTNRRRRIDFALSVTHLAALYGLAIALAASGYGAEVLWLWLIPAGVTVTILAFFHDWMVHHPHDNRERFKDTRLLLSDMPGFELLYAYQNYHLIHHLFPRVPFFRYRAAFAEMRPSLEHLGSPIVTLGRQRS